MNSVHACERQPPVWALRPPLPQESRYAHMDEKLLRALPARPADQVIQETSDEKVWQSPGHTVVDTALEVTAYALTDRWPAAPREHRDRDSRARRRRRGPLDDHRVHRAAARRHRGPLPRPPPLQPPHARQPGRGRHRRRTGGAVPRRPSSATKCPSSSGCCARRAGCDDRRRAVGPARGTHPPLPAALRVLLQPRRTGRSVSRADRGRVGRGVPTGRRPGRRTGPRSCRARPRPPSPASTRPV